MAETSKQFVSGQVNTLCGRDFALSLEKTASPVNLNDVGSVHREFCVISLAKFACLVT